MVKDPGLNPRKWWQTKLKPYCMLKQVAINSDGWMVTNFSCYSKLKELIFLWLLKVKSDAFPISLFLIQWFFFTFWTFKDVSLGPDPNVTQRWGQGLIVTSSPVNRVMFLCSATERWLTGSRFSSIQHFKCPEFSLIPDSAPFYWQASVCGITTWC